MMTHTSLQRVTTLLAPWTTSTETPEPHRLDVKLAMANLLPAVASLNVACWGYLAAITGLDAGVDAGELEVLYHFCAGPDVVTLRVRTSREKAVVPSVCSMIPSASPLERELSEMFGIEVAGTPDPDRLYLPDDWPQGAFPLRKDFSVPHAKESNNDDR